MNTSVRLSAVDLPSLMAHLNRASIGFDTMFDNLRRTAGLEQDRYPPHDIVKNSDTSYTVRVAVAGFREDELNVTLENNVLTVSGSQANRDDDEYIYHGISNKAFSKVLNLADHVVVRDAVYENGLLEIGLDIVVPEELKPKQISIVNKRTES